MIVFQLSFVSMHVLRGLFFRFGGFPNACPGCLPGVYLDQRGCGAVRKSFYGLAQPIEQAESFLEVFFAKHAVATDVIVDAQIGVCQREIRIQTYGLNQQVAGSTIGTDHLARRGK